MARAWRLLREDRTALAGMIIILAFLLVAIFASWLAPFQPTDQHILDAFRPPNATYWLGTDEFGRDIFSRIIHGSRPALLVGLFSVGLSMGIGIPLGLMAGLKMGWLDRVVGWLVDLMLSFPSLLLGLIIVTLLGSGLQMVILAIGIAHVPLFIRLARGSTLVVKQMDFIAAGQSLGASDIYLAFRHILPNIIGPLIVMGTLGIAGAIRQEASLSFLGLGIQPPIPSWGNMIREGVQNILQTPWLALFPGLALTLSVLAYNMVGDSLRDIFDPRDSGGS
jgi:ABC-type dipeptide/oligopeptide/nickel transport system permease subunit